MTKKNLEFGGLSTQGVGVPKKRMIFKRDKGLNCYGRWINSKLKI